MGAFENKHLIKYHRNKIIIKSFGPGEDWVGWPRGSHFINVQYITIVLFYLIIETFGNEMIYAYVDLVVFLPPEFLDFFFLFLF